MSHIREELSSQFDKLRLLGEGATSSAFYGERKSDGLPCVVKVFQRGLDERSTEQPLARFERECKALASLSHKAIVKILEWCATDSFPYLVLEYRAATSLDEFLKKRATPLPWPQAIRIVATLAHALAHAHEHQIIHRDIKPANILLLRDCSPLLIDFGLVRSGLMQTYRTATGVILGSPSYMAPELFGTERADETTDLYSLAVVTHEMVTGKKLFRGSLNEIMRAKLSDPPPILSGLPSIPTALATTIDGLLHQRSERLQITASELAQRLELFLNELGDGDGTATIRATQKTDKKTMKKTVIASSPLADSNGKGKTKKLVGGMFFLCLLLFGLFKLATPQRNMLKLSAEEVGKIVKREGLLSGFTIDSRATAADIGRLYKAREELKGGKSSQALQELLPLLQGGRLETVMEASKIVEMALQSVKTASNEKDLELIDSLAHFLAVVAKQRCKQAEAEKVALLVEQYYRGRPGKSRYWGALCAFLRQINHGRFLREELYGEARALITATAKEGGHSLLVPGVKAESLNKEGLTFLVALSTLMRASEGWKDSWGWSLFRNSITEDAPFPEPRYVRNGAFLDLVKGSPSFGKIAKPYGSYLARVLRRGYFHNRVHSDLRVAWLACYAHEKWGKNFDPQEAERFTKKSISLRICNYRNPALSLSAKDLQICSFFEGWTMIGDANKGWHYLRNLLGSAFDKPQMAHEFLLRAADLAPREDLSEKNRLALINELKAMLKETQYPERRSLVWATLLAIAARTVIVEELPSSGPSDDQFVEIGERFLHARYLSPQSIPFFPQGFTPKQYGLLLCATGVGGASTIETKAFDELTKNLARACGDHKQVSGRNSWLLISLARMSSSYEKQFSSMKVLFPFIETNCKDPVDGTAFKMATAFWPAKRFAKYLEGLKSWHGNMPPNRRCHLELEMVQRLFCGHSSMLAWCGDLKGITNNIDLILSFYTEQNVKVSKDHYFVLMRLLDSLGECGRKSDVFTSQQKRTDGFGEVPYFRTVAKRVIKHADFLLKLPEMPPIYRLQIQFRRINALTDALRPAETKACLDEMFPDDIPIGYRWLYWYEMARWAESQGAKGKQIHELLKKAEELPYMDVTKINVVKLRTVFRL